MQCQGKIHDKDQVRACWLPAEPRSPWRFCRRCTFQFITDEVDAIIAKAAAGGITDGQRCLLQQIDFQRELLHVARRQSLFHLLSVLHASAALRPLLQQHLFPFLLTQRDFGPLLTKTIQNHHYGTRCAFYRYAVCQRPDLFPSSCLCWSCLAYALRQRNRTLRLSVSRSLCLVSDTQLATLLETPKKDILDLFVSLELYPECQLAQGHLLALLGEQGKSDFLSELYAQGAYQHYLFASTDARLAQMRKQTYPYMKKRCHVLLEELMAVTWHPDRFMPWCLDQDDKADIGYGEDGGSA